MQATVTIEWEDETSAVWFVDLDENADIAARLLESEFGNPDSVKV